MRLAPALLGDRPDASASERELPVLQKKMFKVLSAIDKRDGGTFWMRVGSGFTNRDNSVNIYLDVLPKSFQFQLRELDEEDLRKRDSNRGSAGAGSGPAPGGAAEAGLPF